jgi:poly(A) polymerase
MARHLNAWRTAGDAKRTTLADFKRMMASPHFAREQAIWLAEERKETSGQESARAVARRAAAIPKRRIAPPPFVTGEDLKAMGLRQGPLLGKIHRELYDAQLNEQVASRRAALALAKHMIAEANGGQK